MGDIDRVRQNIQTMADKGAPEAEIDQYVRGEGYTAEQIRAGRGLIERGIEAVSDVARGAIEAARGQQDPAFADVPGFTGEHLLPEGAGILEREDVDKIILGKMLAPEDKAFGDIVKKALGERLLKTEEDAHGGEIVTYMGVDGNQHREYINKPGLDYEDIDRAVASALPYAFTGMGMGAALKGLTGGVGAATRMGAQGITEGLTSIGVDVGATLSGSEQPADLGRAVSAAAGGFLFEGLSPAARSTWESILKKRTLDPGGTLSKAARVEAKARDLDPDAMDEKLSEMYANLTARGVDPDEAAAMVRTGEFDIPTSKAQRLKDPDLALMEKEMLQGTWGKEAKAMMREFHGPPGLPEKGEQARAIERAAYEKIGGEIQPQPKGREKATLGSEIQKGMQASKRWFNEISNGLWGRLGPMYPSKPGMDLLPIHVQKALDDADFRGEVSRGELLSGNMPLVNRATEQLEAYMRGKMAMPKSVLLGTDDPIEPTIDQMRRMIGKWVRDAPVEGGQKGALGAIYRGFNNWIDDLADKAMLRGDVSAASRLKIARGWTKKEKALFEPKDKAGKLTAAGTILKNAMEKSDSPESTLTAILGSSGPGTAIPRGRVSALKNLKVILHGGGRPQEVRAAWDDLRLAHWVSLVQNPRTGDILTPRQIRTNLKSVFNKQNSVMTTLYKPAEIKMIKRFERALEDAFWVDPNPSGTATAAKTIAERTMKGVKDALQIQATRERFTKHNFIASNIYRFVARTLPASPFSTAEITGRKAATKFLSQDVSRRPYPTLGPMGAILGAEVGGSQQ